jgi:hypothetical protein
MQATDAVCGVERRSAVRRTRRSDDCFQDGGACAGFAIVFFYGAALGFVVARYLF